MHEKLYFREIKRYDIGGGGGSSVGDISSCFTCEADTRNTRDTRDIRENWLVEAVAVVAEGAALHCRLNLNEFYV